MVSPSSPTPQGSRRQGAVMGTLMPHLHPGVIMCTAMPPHSRCRPH